MSQRAQHQNDPWSQLADEIGDAFLQSFRAEMQKNVSEDTLDKIFNPENECVAVETLAAHAHDEMWAGWMEYLFSKGRENDDGSFTIPASWYWRWKYQAGTPYTQLPEDMKESDREEARRILRLLEAGDE